MAYWVNLDKNVNMNKNMNKNYSYPTTIYESCSTQIYVFLVLFKTFDFDHEQIIRRNLKNIFFCQKFVHLGENTFIYCSWLIAVHFHVNIYS